MVKPANKAENWACVLVAALVQMLAFIKAGAAESDFVGWACGGQHELGGILLRLTNGADWVRCSVGQLGSNALCGVAAAGREVWVIGEPVDGYAVIFHSADMGATWQRQGDAESLPNAVLQKIKAITPKVLWAAGVDGAVVVTTNGGVSWRDVSISGFTGMLQGVTAADGFTAWVSGDFDAAVGCAALWCTHDGGASWQQQATGAITNVDHILGLAALDSRRVWAIGASETILATTNGGATWALFRHGPQKDGNEIRVLDENRIWTANDAHVSWTTNGGVSWGTHNTAEYTMDVATPDGTNVWAVSSSFAGGLIYYSPDGGVSWSVQAESNSWRGLFTIEVVSTATGAIQTILLPAAAVAAGARWRVDAGEWQISGAVIGELTAGRHVVEFSAAAGYVAPSSAMVVVEAGVCARVEVRYATVDEARRLPVCADFDGDQRADPAVARLTDGDWRGRLSSVDYTWRQMPAAFGTLEEMPLAADFDGDGLADPAAYDPETGTMMVRFSSASYELRTCPHVLRP